MDLSLQIFLIHYISKVRLWWRILVANLATNFQDLVAKVKDLVTLVPVLGAISCPALPFPFLLPPLSISNMVSTNLFCFKKQAKTKVIHPGN